MAVTLTYTDPTGKAATFYTQKQGGQHPVFLLTQITGVGGVLPEYENTPLTGGDGSYLGSARYPSRSIQTVCMVYGATAQERDTNLRGLIGLLNTKNGDGTLTYQNHEGKYTIAARCKVLPGFEANSLKGNWKPIIIDYECPYPFFKGSVSFSELIAASDATFRLPFRMPFRLGNLQYKGDAVNVSSIPAPVKIIIYGPSVNPVLTNRTTGGALRVRKSIATGETLTIVTGPVISATISNLAGVSDALNYVDLISSQWIQLQPGRNALGYSSDNALKNTRIEVHWNDWYLGVG